jgi:FtsH-binding integral membrane protein
MWWILFVVMQAVFVVHGYRQEKRRGLWSGSKFAFALAFAALEGTLLIVPILTVDSKSSKFLPALGVAATIAALNFIWFIILCRRWKLPDGSTSLQAYSDFRDRK